MASHRSLSRWPRPYRWTSTAGVRARACDRLVKYFCTVASDNYLMPALVGTAMPASTKLDMKDFKTFGT